MKLFASHRQTGFLLGVASMLCALFLFSTTSTFAQSRDYHAQRIVLDDGNGHTATVEYTGTTSTTFGIPTNAPSAGSVMTNDGSGGTTWQSPLSNVPSGTVIMSTSSTTPSGYTFLGGPVSISTGPGSWVGESSTGASVRTEGGAVTVNGKVYVIGGYDGSSTYYSDVEVYDPVANSWSTDVTTGTYTPRASVGVAVCNGLIYVMGGATSGGYSTANEAYDPIAKSWTTKTPMPQSRTFYALESSGNYVYALSGQTNGNITATDVYDAVNNNWNITKTAATMPSITAYPTAAVLNGKFYLAGGLGTGSNQYLMSYDPGTDTWTSLSTTSFTDRNQPGVAAAAGKLYVFGGLTRSGFPGPPTFNYVTTNETYDPTTNTWSPSVTTGFTGRYQIMSAVVNGTIYAFGGYNGSTNNTMQALTSGFSAYYYVKN